MLVLKILILTRLTHSNKSKHFAKKVDWLQKLAKKLLYPPRQLHSSCPPFILGKHLLLLKPQTDELSASCCQNLS